MGTLSGSCSVHADAEKDEQGKFYLLQGCYCLNGFDSEVLVDVPVGGPVGLVKHRPVRHGVEEGPEGGVAAAVVVKLELLQRSEEVSQQLSMASPRQSAVLKPPGY